MQFKGHGVGSDNLSGRTTAAGTDLSIDLREKSFAKSWSSSKGAANMTTKWITTFGHDFYCSFMARVGRKHAIIMPIIWFSISRMIIALLILITFGTK